MDFIEMKNIHQKVLSSDRQPEELENIFESHVADKGLISRIHKELLHFNHRETTQLKSMKDLNTHFSEEDNTNDQKTGEKMLHIIRH